MQKALLLNNADFQILKMGGRIILPLADGEEVLLMFQKDREPRKYNKRGKSAPGAGAQPGNDKQYRSPKHKAAYIDKSHRGFQKVRCPTCSKTVTRFGVQVHHSKKHGRYLSQKEKEKLVAATGRPKKQ